MEEHDGYTKVRWATGYKSWEPQSYVKVSGTGTSFPFEEQVSRRLQEAHDSRITKSFYDYREREINAEAEQKLADARLKVEQETAELEANPLFGQF